jgi:SAM-dependent methyltransferase
MVAPSIPDAPSSQDLGFGLEGLEDGLNYYAWLAGALKPALGGRVVEHGAGTGALSLALLQAGARELVVTEPTPNLLEILRRKLSNRSEVEIFAGTLEDFLAHSGARTVDGIVSSNVLEHIEDDAGCLRAMWTLLRPGGTLGLYVPARPEIYGKFDRAVGHCRRYRRRELKSKLAAAGFELQHIEYRNVLAGVAWFINGRLLKKDDVNRGGVKFFDQYIFPVCRVVEDLVPLPWGQNLLAIARRPL